MKRSLLTEIGIGLLILLYSYTSTSKLVELEKFIFQMRLSPFKLMHPLAPILGYGVPILEIIITILILFPITRRLALKSSAILLSIFSVYIFVLLVSGVHLPCTCGGVISKMSWRTHLLFNLAYLMINLYCLRTTPARTRPSYMHAPFTDPQHLQNY